MFDSNHKYNIYGRVDNIFNGEKNYYKTRILPLISIINLQQFTFMYNLKLSMHYCNILYIFFLTDCRPLLHQKICLFVIKEETVSVKYYCMYIYKLLSLLLYSCICYCIFFAPFIVDLSFPQSVNKLYSFHGVM